MADRTATTSPGRDRDLAQHRARARTQESTRSGRQPPELLLWKGRRSDGRGPAASARLSSSSKSGGEVELPCSGCAWPDLEEAVSMRVIALVGHVFDACTQADLFGQRI